MPKRNSDYMAAQRQRILEAALECFAEHGLHNTSIERIAQAARCGKSVIYAHFSSKNAIVQAIARQEIPQGEFQGLSSLADLTAFLVAGYADLESPERRKKIRLAMAISVESLDDAELRDWLSTAFDQTLDLMQGVIREDPATAHCSPAKARDIARQLTFFWAGQGIYKMLFPSLPVRTLKKDMKDVVRSLIAKQERRAPATSRNDGASNRR